MKLAKYIRPYLPFVLLAPISMVGEVSMDLLQPKLMSKIVDDGVLGSDYGLIIRTGIIMLCTVIFGALCGSASAFFAGCASQGFSRDVRNDLFKRVMGLSFQQTDKFTTGSLVTRITADVTAIQQMVDFLIRGFVRNIIMFIGGIIMMLTLARSFGTIIAVALPVEALIVILIMRKANPLYAIVASRLDSVNSVMQENVTGARVVKAYVREKHEQERFEGANMGLTVANLKVQELMALLSPILMVIMNFSVMAVIYIGGWQVQAKEMKVGEVMAAITYLTQVLHGIMMISMMFQTMARASASAKRINEVLDTEPVIRDGNGGDIGTKKGTVTFRGVTFAYPESSGEPVLTDIDLDIAAGENIAILGATGSGKSSLVNLIPRFYDADQGEVLVDGVNVREFGLEDLRQRVGIVLQKSELFSATVAENIRWGKDDATDEEVISAAKIAQADEFISRMPEGYDSMIAEKGASLSGGQKQRMSIARAILKKPEILIFDDSTSALDLGTEARLRAQLREGLKGTTVITIAQRIASVKSCDRIVVLDRGRIVGCDSHDALLKNCEVYRDIYNSQIKTQGGEA
ncbi:ABC transporter ATP-binding protein [Ruminococcus albus]|uniref:ATP-binding cassette, subfamily B n=1 Tax=Ruminococcus albus TaxID=1264 RepID=A0A1I1GFN3_RUMAL|nr:ABC transporter ATP-binding protein [Ruminococcus albus]SFC10569.1 ATP-binding cassette, subfamily B [Ruminococcus albus]